MRVLVTSGIHKGLLGEIRGDLKERRKTLGKEGKVLVRTDKRPPYDIVWIRTKHLQEAVDLFSVQS